MNPWRMLWSQRAACLNLDDTTPEGAAFYPEPRGSSNANAAAKAICAGCPVRLECLQWALDNNEQYGIWGGLSWTERRELKRRRVA